MALSDDINACALQVQRGDPDRFMAAMAAPVSVRKVLFPLFAFNLEVARAPWVTQESMIAEMRLQWWRDALEEIAQGGKVRRHEVVTPLSEILTSHLARTLDELIEARRWDIYKDPFEDLEHFKRYIDRTSGHLLWVAAQLVGVAEETTLRQVVYAHGLTRWFQAIPKLESEGRVPLVDGRPESIHSIAQEALDGIASARRSKARISKAAGKVLLCGWQSEVLLKQVVDNPYRVQEGALGQSDFKKRLSLTWNSFSGRW